MLFAQRYQVREAEASTVIVLSTAGFMLSAPLWLTLLDLWRRYTVNGLRFGLRRSALTGLPVAVGCVGQHAQSGQAAVGQCLPAIFARTLVTQQQAQRTGRQCATTGT